VIVVFSFRVGCLLCVMCVICVLCLILVPLPPGENPFAVKKSNNIPTELHPIHHRTNKEVQ
jgi:hypothetical protein